MKLKETTHYAVRIIIYLSFHKDTTITIQQISKDTRISAKYLAKILHTLKANELVVAIRGCEGGYKLNPERKHISLYDVIHSTEKGVDEISKITTYYDPNAKTKIEEINNIYSNIQVSCLNQLKQYNLLT